MKNIIALGVFLGLCSSTFVWANDGARLGEMVVNNSPYQIQLFTGIYKQNSADSYVTANALVPLIQSQDALLFAQIGRMQDFNIAAVTSGNLGLRWLTHEQSMLWGVYAGYDYQKTNNNNVYHHIALGGEWRSERWHFYSNAYLPISTQKKTIVSDNTTARLTPETDGNGFHNVELDRIFIERQEEALRGLEANLGYTFLPAINAQLYLGAYSYRANQVASVKGSRAQLNFDLFNAAQSGQHSNFLNRISVESMVQYDKANKTSWYAGLKFVFDVTPKRVAGRFTPLARMQQYMQDEIKRNAGTLIDSYDETFTSSGKHRNAAGDLYTVAKVSDEAAFDYAIDNFADVIAVQGSIDGLSTKVLNDNQTLTGGDHTLGDGTILALGDNGKLTAAAGHDLIRVGKNNRIENITLHAAEDEKMNVISNDGRTSVGNLTIDNVKTNSGMQFIVQDGGADNNISITHSVFTMPDGDEQTAIYALLQSGAMSLNIANNTIIFGNGSSNYGIYLYSFAVAAGVNSVIYSTSINNNDISFKNGSSSSAIRFFASDGPGYIADMIIDNIRNNTINLGTGNNNSGLYIIGLSRGDDMHGQMIVNNIIGNSVDYTSGQALSGMSAEIGNVIGVTKLTINTIYDNAFNMGTPSTGGEDANYGFRLISGSLFTDNSKLGSDSIDSLDGLIIINVNHRRQGLYAANHNATVNPIDERGDGKIIIKPELVV